VARVDPVSERTFIGGLRYQGFGGARSNLSLPFARLTIDASSVRFAPRGPFRWVLPEVALARDDVVAIDSDWGISRMGVRFVSRTDAVVFWARRRDLAAITAALGAAGFPEVLSARG